MIRSLHIENIAVIRSVDLDLKEGFTTLTGETGAGKSKIIDALGLLVGDKPQKDLIRSGEETAMVSALFSELDPETVEALASLGVSPDEEGNLFLQRTVSLDGKAQTRLNGRLIPVSLQRQIAPLLIDIHGQHDNQALLDPSSHIGFLDEYANNGALLEKYRAVYGELTETSRRIAELNRGEMEKQRQIEMLTYQIADIDAVAPKEGEEEELETRKRKIRDSEKIRKSASLVYRALYRNEKGLSASDLIAKAASAMDSLTDYLPDAADLADKLRDFRFEVADIGQSVGTLLEEEEDDDAIDRIESRLNDLHKLKRKYGSDIAEVLSFREKAAAQLEQIEQSDELLSELTAKYDKYRAEACALAEEICAGRMEAAGGLEENITAELRFLEMTKVVFKVQIKRLHDENGLKLNANGSEEVEFLISVNPGEPVKPMSRIASGGELSRIMLAIKSIGAKKEHTGTMLFDEIDTGVSGKTSQKIGIRLRRLGERTQVLCVTHSAQIAAVSHSHFLISKSQIGERTETRVAELCREERVKELARIMGGAQITEKLLSTAEELLSEYNPA